MSYVVDWLLMTSQLTRPRTTCFSIMIIKHMKLALKAIALIYSEKYIFNKHSVGMNTIQRNKLPIKSVH